MSTTIRKGLLGKEDVKFYTAASPTFARITSSAGSTTLTAVAATHIPLVQSAASLYFSQNTVQRGLNETISRYIAKDHSLATFAAGAGVGDHKKVFGYRNAVAATSIQAAASNAFLANGIAVMVIPPGTYTLATPIQLPRRCVVIGAGKHTVIRSGSTTQVSRLFSISGSSGATSQVVTAPVQVGTSTLTVTNGAQYVSGNWIEYFNYPKREYFKVKSVAGNVLSLSRPTGFQYAAGTAKVIYPAEVVLDKMQLTLSSGTQGIGVAATYMMESTFGSELYISGAAEAAIKLTKSYGNKEEAHVEPTNRTIGTTGQPYGVWCTDASQDNKLLGTRSGQRDVADGKSTGNYVFGPRFGISGSIASGPSYPLEKIYRMTKPELSYVTYAATVAVSCPASATVPAEVFINGRVFRNTGTTICDLSRTITPAAATIGGLDRGPATATRAYYIYAVPSQNSSATRQFDLMASIGAPNNTPTASASFPVWSYLGAVSTAGTVRLHRFAQAGDQFSIWDNSDNMFNVTSPISAQATFRQVTSAKIPVGAKRVDLYAQITWNALVVDAGNNTFSVNIAHGDAVNVNQKSISMQLNRNQDAASGVLTLPTASIFGTVPVNSNRQVAYRIATAGTANFNAVLCGYSLPRANYK